MNPLQAMAIGLALTSSANDIPYHPSHTKQVDPDYPYGKVSKAKKGHPHKKRKK